MSQEDLEKRVTSTAYQLVRMLQVEDMDDRHKRAVSAVLGEIANPTSIITLAQIVVDSQEQTSSLLTAMIQLCKLCRERDDVPEELWPKVIEAFVNKGLQGYDPDMVEAMLSRTRPLAEMLEERDAPGTSRLVDASGNRVRS